MPVYIRKNVSYTPPSLDKLPVEDEDDFITDPELYKDDLPQPFRMIDKTLRNLVDDTWEIIASREEQRIAEANIVRPPQYESSVQLETAIAGSQFPEKQKLCNATCMSNSPDGNFIFVGLPCGVVVLEALNQHVLGFWEEDGAEMAFIKSYTIAPQTYLLTSIDDMGIGRLFAFCNCKLFLLKVLNTAEKEFLVSKIESSPGGDYLGLVMEHGSTHELWLEIHKLPRESWLNDLDMIMAAIKKKEEKERKEEMMSEANDTESVAPSEVAPSKADTDEPSVASMPNSAQPDQLEQHSQLQVDEKCKALWKEVSHSAVEIEKVKLKRMNSQAACGVPLDPLSGDYKFGAPQLLTKVKPPTPATGTPVGNLLASCQKVESGDVVGTGQNLLYTSNHLELRQTVFDHMHENLLKYQADDELHSNVQQFPHFHFLTAGCMLPYGLEQASLEGRPTTVAVWWPGSTNLMQYSLIKPSKDTEFKPDLVWPFTCKITCTEVSQDTNIIAIGLENGNIVVWDRYMGSQRGVINIRDDSPVVQIKFLDTALFPQDYNAYPPYAQGTGTYILVMCANSALYTVSTASRLALQLNTISVPVENDNDTITVLEPFTHHPDLLLTVTRRGDIQVRDTLQGNIVCQVKLPKDFEMSSPWEPVLAVGGQGQNMYVKGNKKVEEDSSEAETDSTVQSGLVFVYQMRSFPTLDEYWKIHRTSQPLTVHVTQEQRADALLADRLCQQVERKNRMQERWTQMREEIANIHQLKEVARINAQKRSIVTPGSVTLFPVKTL